MTNMPRTIWVSCPVHTLVSQANDSNPFITSFNISTLRHIHRIYGDCKSWSQLGVVLTNDHIVLDFVFVIRERITGRDDCERYMTIMSIKSPCTISVIKNHEAQALWVTLCNKLETTRCVWLWFRVSEWVVQWGLLYMYSDGDIGSSKSEEVRFN